MARNLGRIVRQKVAKSLDQAQVAGHVNAVIATSTEPGTTHVVRNRQHVRVVQHGGHTEVFESDESGDSTETGSESSR